LPLMARGSLEQGHFVAKNREGFGCLRRVIWK
jgi:hypothetical protein